MAKRSYPITEILYEYLRKEISDFEPYNFNELKQNKDLYNRFNEEYKKRLNTQWKSVLKLFYMDSFLPILNYTHNIPFTDNEKATIITLMTIYGKDYPALRYLKKVLSRKISGWEEGRAYIKKFLCIGKVDADVYVPSNDMAKLDVNFATDMAEEGYRTKRINELYSFNTDYGEVTLFDMARSCLNDLTQLIEKRIDLIPDIISDNCGADKKEILQKEIGGLFSPLAKEQLDVKKKCVLFALYYEEKIGNF